MSCLASTVTVVTQGESSIIVSGYDGLVVNTELSTGSSDVASITLNFMGRDDISTLISDSTDDGEFTIFIAESNPSSGSSAGSSMLMYDGTSSTMAMALLWGPLSWLTTQEVMAECQTETLDVVINTPHHWVTVEDGNGNIQVSVGMVYGYSMDITLSGENTYSFDQTMQDALLVCLNLS